MNLHHDHEAFSELIAAASNELRIPPGIVEIDKTGKEVCEFCQLDKIDTP